jgi:secondary thiamine-phosphate synthase enzyme
MKWYKTSLTIGTKGPGMVPITGQVASLIQNWGVNEGMLSLFIQHTSASLVINESYDPSARLDMEEFMRRLAPEQQAWYQHVLEGVDDSPSHLKSMITPVSLSIPVDGGKLSLGTWQGIYLFEHRRHRQQRTILVRCLDVGVKE